MSRDFAGGSTDQIDIGTWSTTGDSISDRRDKRTAMMNKTELVAGVSDMDDALDSLISSHTGTDTILQAINKELAEPFVSIATNQDKSETLAAVTAKRTGLT